MRNWEINWRGCGRNQRQGKVGNELDERVLFAALFGLFGGAARRRWSFGQRPVVQQPTPRLSTDPGWVQGPGLIVRGCVTSEEQTKQWGRLVVGFTSPQAQAGVTASTRSPEIIIHFGH